MIPSITGYFHCFNQPTEYRPITKMEASPSSTEELKHYAKYIGHRVKHLGHSLLPPVAINEEHHTTTQVGQEERLYEDVDPEYGDWLKLGEDAGNVPEVKSHSESVSIECQLMTT